MKYFTRLHVSLFICFLLVGCRESVIELDNKNFERNSLLNGKSFTWLGSVNNNWDDASNWANGIVPVSNGKVIISKDCINCAIDLESSTQVHSINFDPAFNGSLKMNGYDLSTNQLATSLNTTIYTHCADLNFNAHSPNNGNIQTSPNTPSLTVSGNRVQEGQSLVFKFRLSEPNCLADTKINFDINDMQATLADNDYTNTPSAQITITKGQIDAEFLVATNDDSKYELDESVSVIMTTVENSLATIGTSQGVGTIEDNDILPILTINSCAAPVEGADCIMSFSLAVPLEYDVSFDWGTIDDSAAAGADYIGITEGNIVLAAGQTTISKTVKTINDFPLVDAGESFKVHITNLHGVSTGLSEVSINLNESGVNALSLSPATIDLNSSEVWTFNANGGQAPYTYAIQTGVGTISAAGLYTAPQTGASPVVVQVTDNAGTVATANLTFNQTYKDLEFCSAFFENADEGKIFDDGGIAGDYTANQNCQIWLSSFNGQPIVLTFNSFVMEDGDSLEVKNGNTGMTIATYDKNNLPPASLVTNENRLNFDYITDATTQAAGFDIGYSSLGTPGSLSIDSYIDASTWEVGWNYSIEAYGGIGPYKFTVLSGEGSVNFQDDEVKVADFFATYNPGNVVIQVEDSTGTKAQLSATVNSTAMALSSISRSTGSGGESVYIYGVGFQPQMQFYFGNKLCTGVIVYRSTQARCTIPIGDNTVNFYAYNAHPAKLEQATISNAFTYYPGNWTRFVNQPGGSGNDRYSVASVWTGEHFIVWGGTDGSSSYSVGNYNNGYVYHALTDSWTSMSSSGMSNKSNTAHVWTGTEFIIHNGLVNGNSAPHEGRAYNPYTNSWRSIATPPSTSYLHGRRAIWTGEEMIVTGGKWNGYSGSSYAYDPNADTWRTLASITSRYFHDMVWTGERVIVYGGYNGSGSMSSGQIYNMQTNTWSSIDTTYNTKKYGWDQTSVGTYLSWSGNRMIIAGGSTSGGDKTGVYNPYTDTWEVMTQPTSSTFNSGRIINTGKDIIYSYGSTNMAYDIDKDSWQRLKNPNTTSTSHGAFHYNGNSAYQCFGNGKTTEFCENLSLENLNNPVTNLAANTWGEMKVLNQPSARAGHSMTWSGKNIIVFGGEDNSGVVNTGYIYNPFKEEWSSISSVNSPSARKGHSAVWLGEKLLIWGGVDSNGAALGTGAIYHPELDTWTTISTTNSPSARKKFALAKSNHKVVVWGGSDTGNIAINDGAIYNPSTDIWTTISNTTPASGGEDVAAVFAGRNKVAIFGGDTNIGGILNVSTNTWVQMSTTNAPAISKGHSLIFAKGKVLVFGGESGGGINSDIKLYNPALDTWETKTHTLTARKNHLSVMTGNKLMLYGGEDIGGVIGQAEVLDLNDFSKEVINSTSVTVGIREGVWIGHIGENHFGYRNNHSGDSYGLFLFGGSSSSSTPLTNGVIYKPASY